MITMCLMRNFMVTFFSRRHRRHEHFVLKLRVTLLPSVKLVTILQSAASNHTATLFTTVRGY